MNKKHYEESVKAEDIITRLNELEKEKAKIIWMEKFDEMERKPVDIAGSILIQEAGGVTRIKIHKVWEIIYKK